MFLVYNWNAFHVWFHVTTHLQHFFCKNSSHTFYIQLNRLCLVVPFNEWTNHFTLKCWHFFSKDFTAFIKKIICLYYCFITTHFNLLIIKTIKKLTHAIWEQKRHKWKCKILNKNVGILKAEVFKNKESL